MFHVKHGNRVKLHNDYKVAYETGTEYSVPICFRNIVQYKKSK